MIKAIAKILTEIFCWLVVASILALIFGAVTLILKLLGPTALVVIVTAGVCALLWRIIKENS